MDNVVNFMREHTVDIWFLAVGAPQQEILAMKARDDGRVTGTALCIGASLDFLTGVEKRAPRAISAMGMEWLWRLIKDPGGKWRRYLIEGPRIFILFFRDLLKSGNS